MAHSAVVDKPDLIYNDPPSRCKLSWLIFFYRKQYNQHTVGITKPAHITSIYTIHSYTHPNLTHSFKDHNI
jgi:hypothetical protein